MHPITRSNRVFKPSHFSSGISISALSLAFWAGAIHSGSAQVLLTINDSDPSAVVITATGADPAANTTGNIANDGVDLLQFFTLDEVNMTAGQFLTGTLTGGNIGVNYNDVWADYQSTGNNSSFHDMELYVDINSPGEANAESFSTTQPAFSGTWTIDMTPLGVTSAALPSAGTQGNIIAGYSGNPGSVIGQWQVAAVPEPGTTSLAVIGFAATGFAMLRQRRKTAKN